MVLTTNGTYSVAKPSFPALRGWAFSWIDNCKGLSDLAVAGQCSTSTDQGNLNREAGYTNMVH